MTRDLIFSAIIVVLWLLQYPFVDIMKMIRLTIKFFDFYCTTYVTDGMFYLYITKSLFNSYTCNKILYLVLEADFMSSILIISHFDQFLFN